MLAYLQGEPAGARVRALMEDAERSGVPLLLNEVNAGEVFYMRAKTRSIADAEHFLDLLPTWPIQLVHNVFDDVLAAARLKTRFPISYADAFAAATALRAGAQLVTGDDEFHALDEILDIVWLPS
jgi:ribonuclease VapC